MKTGAPPSEVFWQGPSWAGTSAATRRGSSPWSTACSGPEDLFRRFPGVEGSAYLVGGLGRELPGGGGDRAAPIRAGLGLRLGANVGYLVYSRQRNLLPF
jgi:hypothetical protein